MSALPLTVGTGGHIDHGKTALVRALTGTDTDRLPEEKARGITIDLGFALLELPGGRRLSVVDVPGHERFVRTMVAGATGIDLFLMVVAADDGVMPQTREHAAVMRALGVGVGVVAVTKSDIADPQRAGAEARALLPGVEVVACSARTGAGVAELRDALGRAAERLPGRGSQAGPPLLHVDRSFSIRGAGTVVTGTLSAGTAGVGDSVELLPSGRQARVRGVHVHDRPVERALAGQRVALNLAGVQRDQVTRGDVLTATGSGLTAAWILDAALDVVPNVKGARVHVHHGTRESAGRLIALGDGFWQMRLERPLVARTGDRVVVRSIAPPDTLGGGTIVEARARRHGARSDVVAQLRRRLSDEPEPAPEPAPTVRPGRVVPVLTADAFELESSLLDAGHEPPADAELGDVAAELAALRSAGRIVRMGRGMHVHVDALAAVGAQVEAIIAVEGDVTLARLRDELRTSRKYAQALLEALDAARVTLRLPDERRVLRRRR